MQPFVSPSAGLSFDNAEAESYRFNNGVGRDVGALGSFSTTQSSGLQVQVLASFHSRQVRAAGTNEPSSRFESLFSAPTASCLLLAAAYQVLLVI